MATDARTWASPEPSPPSPGVVDRGDWLYDRSSLRGDFMVMIADQTIEEYWRHAPPNQICEYIDGVIYMPNAPTDEHQDVAGFLFFLLNGFRCERGTGPVRFGPGALSLREDRFPQPDVFVLPPEGRADVPALLVIEIPSPSTRAHDLGMKRSIYRESGIPEIWFIDLAAHQITRDRRGPRGYVTEVGSGGIQVVESMPGFWIEIAWLWAEPLPNVRRCLEAILAGPPGGG